MYLFDCIFFAPAETSIEVTEEASEAQPLCPCKLSAEITVIVCDNALVSVASGLGVYRELVYWYQH